MAQHRWAVDAITDEFLYGGVEPYDCTPGLSDGQIRVVTTRAPQPATEKYSRDPTNPIAPKTDVEIASSALAQATAGARNDILSNMPVLTNLALALEATLGRKPSQDELKARVDDWVRMRLLLRQKMGR